MNPIDDPPRLKVAGTEEDRALLREAGSAPVPEELRRRVRLAVEAEVSPAGRRRTVGRWVLIGASTLIAGSAAAYSVGVIRSRLAAPELPAPPAPAPRRPDVQPLPGQPLAPAPLPAAPAPRRRAQPGSTAESVRPLPSLGGPGLPNPPGEWSYPESTPQAAPPPASGGRLLIAHQGRQPVAITLAGPKITGDVRGASVALELQGKELTRISGKAADENISLLIQGSEARGNMAGHDVGFVLVPTSSGHLVRGSLPGLSARIEIGDQTLSWFPGCEQPLRLVRPGTYEGRCAGGETRVMIPEPWQRLPVFQRLILLALFLVESEPGMPDKPRTLFGPPDWPSR